MEGGFKKKKNNHNCCGFVPIFVSNHTPHQYTYVSALISSPLHIQSMRRNEVFNSEPCTWWSSSVPKNNVANISSLVLVVNCGLALRYGQKKIFDIFFQLCFYSKLCAGGLNFGIQNHMTTVLKMVHNSFFHDLFYKSF